MENNFYTDEFKNMVASNVFNEVITLIFHQGHPGDTGNANTFGATAGILNMNPNEWEVGDTGIVQNKNAIDVGVLSTSRVFVRYITFWRENGEYLGFKKVLRNLSLPGGKFFRISARSIRFKFF